MKANEFIKKFGWAKACDIIVRMPDKFMSCYYSNVCYCMKYKKYSDRFKPRESLINMGDLRRLVESHKAIARLGGLERAKLNLISTDRCLGYTHVYLHRNGYYCFLDDCVDYIIPERAIDIKLAIKAIADVEGCQ